MKKKKTHNSMGNELELMKKELGCAISHLVRTPLSITKEGISLVLDEIPGELNPKQRRILHAAKENIDRLTKSVDKILTNPSKKVIRQAKTKIKCKRKRTNK